MYKAGVFNAKLFAGIPSAEFVRLFSFCNCYLNALYGKE